MDRVLEVALRFVVYVAQSWHVGYRSYLAVKYGLDVAASDEDSDCET